MKRIINQYCKEVSDYSSQYGSIGSISYVADNICGGVTLFPDYGDFSGSYSMQTYGKWWKTCPSASPCVPDRNPLLAPAVDFVDLIFEMPVIPKRVDVYEVYNAGSIVRIWGCLYGEDFTLLWSGSPTHQPAVSRIFSPPIIQPEKFISMIRLEIDTGTHDYHCAFEAVLLSGLSSVVYPDTFGPISSSLNTLTFNESVFSEKSILEGAKYLMSDELDKLTLCSSTEEEGSETGEEEVGKEVEEEKEEEKEEEETEAEDEEMRMKNGVWKRELESEVEELLSQEEEEEEEEEKKELEGGHFGMLPEELLIYIMKLIDLQSLSRLSCTCKILNSHAKCPVLYQNLNLKNCWSIVRKSTLTWLSGRCSQLKALDLSWCGSYSKLSSQSFMEFINQCGHNLEILHLRNCHFVDNYCLYIIANTCSKLEALSLSSNEKVDQLGFGELKKLTSLTYLDISRTRIDFRTLHVLLQSVGRLKHLSLHHCSSLDMEMVCQTLGTFNGCLVSLGAWKTSGLTARGLRHLASISTLEELDLGWSFDRSPGPITESLTELLVGNVFLKKVFLTGMRVLSDLDLDMIASYGKSLQQVDVMGSRNISPEAVLRLLEQCKTLELLDVSYCDQIHSSHVQQWRLKYPKVTIQGGQKNHVTLW